MFTATGYRSCHSVRARWFARRNNSAQISPKRQIDAGIDSWFHADYGRESHAHTQRAPSRR